MEWVAMPFGMCNAQATLQRIMNDNMRAFLHKFVTVYRDDGNVYNRTMEENLDHLRLVLQRSKE
jgi:lysozyme family protein